MVREKLSVLERVDLNFSNLRTFDKKQDLIFTVHSTREESGRLEEG